jgi:long-chain acyl-CoA synthetase
MPGTDPGPDTAAELIAFCREHLAHLKCPRSVDFTGQLYKKALRDRYWGESRSRIVGL